MVLIPMACNQEDELEFQVSPKADIPVTNLTESSAQDRRGTIEEATCSTTELVRDSTPTTLITTNREMSYEPTYVTVETPGN